MDKQEREMLRSEYKKVWKSDSRMVDYCANKAAEVAHLPGGELVVIDKEGIKKDFCFGESGYDADEAAASAAHARSSEDYFKSRNMEHFDSLIAEISNSTTGEGYMRMVIYTNGAYFSQPDDCNLHSIGFARLTDIIDACGGSCRLDELPGKPLTVRFQPCRIATREEHEIILSAYDAARAAHEKRVNTYLKRYGLSQVHSWTYWRDA